MYGMIKNEEVVWERFFYVVEWLWRRVRDRKDEIGDGFCCVCGLLWMNRETKGQFSF